MPLPDFETTTLDDMPCVRVAGADRPLVILPGVNDALVPVTDYPRFWAKLCRAFAGQRTVYVISRPRGIPAGATTAVLAAIYARAIERHIGKTDILGVSIGGMIAQPLALGHPQLVQSAVFALTCGKPSPAKIALYRQWLAWARDGAWRDVYTDMIAKTYARCGRDCDASWLTASPNAVLKRELDPGDFITTIEACIAHDMLTALNQLAVPTLVLTASDDVLMPPDAGRTLADAIPGAKLAEIAEAGHGAFEQQPKACARAVLEFWNSLES